MALVLGLLVALTYGSGDFFGGLAAKRAPTTAVIIGSFALGSVGIGVVTVAWGAVGTLPHAEGRDLAIGAAVGVLGPLGLGLLYRGLATGRMSVVAPITAVIAAIVPLAWGLAAGERPSAVALVGVAVALVAVALISGAPTHEDHPADAPDPPILGVIGPAAVSGLAFGAIFVLLGQASDHAGLWPLVVARPVAAAISVAAALVLARRAGVGASSRIVAPAAAWPYVVGAGVLDVSANGLYLAATNRGLLSIVAVLSSLYPAATVIGARVVLGERLHRLQLAGLALALAGVAAMATA
jgi:drug/metabolite transporter (DMT)-like permease